MSAEIEIAIVGGGPAGLGVAGALRRRRIDAVVFERSEVGQSWRGRYDSMKLNTVRWMSGLPGMRVPRSTGRWPSRDDYVAYLERYATQNRLEVRRGIEIQRVDRDDSGYRLRTSDGTLAARYVVVAAGYDHDPRLPDWPGRDGFEGE